MKAERIKYKKTPEDLKLCYLRSKMKKYNNRSEVHGYMFALKDDNDNKSVLLKPFEDLEIEQYKLMTWYWTDAVVIRDKLKRIGKEFDVIPFSVIENRNN